MEDYLTWLLVTTERKQRFIEKSIEVMRKTREVAFLLGEDMNVVDMASRWYAAQLPETQLQILEGWLLDVRANRPCVVDLTRGKFCGKEVNFDEFRIYANDK